MTSLERTDVYSTVQIPKISSGSISFHPETQDVRMRFLQESGPEISTGFLNFSLSTYARDMICVYVRVSMLLIQRIQGRIMNLLCSSDIVTVTAITSYKILPGALPPKKRRVQFRRSRACFLHDAAGSAER